MTYDQASQDPLSGREVVFTLDRGFRKPLVGRGIAALIATVPGLLLVLLAAGAFSAFVWCWVVVTGVVTLDYAVRYLWVGRFRTRLSAEGIEIRGYFNHFVPWAEVTGVEVTGYAVPTRTAPTSSQRAARRLDSTSGVRAKLFTVRIARVGHRRRMLLRAPLVAGLRPRRGRPRASGPLGLVRCSPIPLRLAGRGARPVPAGSSLSWRWYSAR
jgi:hypothetical protein